MAVVCSKDDPELLILELKSFMLYSHHPFDPTVRYSGSELRGSQGRRKQQPECLRHRAVPILVGATVTDDTNLRVPSSPG